MEWLTLLVIIPAIVVPVVLLLGFAGCQLAFPHEGGDDPEFEQAFTETLTERRDQAGRTIVQRIEPTRLFKSGSKVKITVRSSDVSDVVIDRVYISQPVDAGTGDPYDSKGDLTEIPTAPGRVPQDTVKTFAIDYALDRTKPLLIIFDIGTPGGVRVRLEVPSTEAIAFVGPGGEAGLADRQPPPAYNDQPRIYLVEQIDVA